MQARDAVIVAGGRGTRLRPLTLGTPKPLVEFCGEPFLVGVLRRLAAADVERVLLVVGADTEPFEVLRPTATELGLTLESVPEPEPLDTAGGVRAVAERLRGPTLVLNGDILTDIDFRGIVEHHVSTGAAATISLERVEDTSSFGVCVLEGTRLVGFVEKPAPGTLPGQDTINAGTYVLEPEVLLRFDEGPLSFERTVFPALVDGGDRVEGWVWEGAWADLGTPDRYRAGHRAALGGELRWPAVEAVAEDGPHAGDGVRIAAGATVAPDVHVHGPVLVLDGATVGAGVRLGPDVVVGEDVTVGPGGALTDTVLGTGTAVGAGVRAAGLVTGPGAVVDGELTVLGDTVVGPGAHLAADTPVPSGTRVPDAS